VPDRDSEISRRGAVGLITAFALGLSACERSGNGSADFPESVDLAMQTWIGYGYAVVAGEKEFFGDMAVSMSIVEDGSALAGAMTGGTAEIIGSTLDQFVLQRSNNLPGQLLVLTDDSFGGDGMAVTRTIRTLADARGKRVAYTPGPSSEYVLATALRSRGMTLDDIEPITFPDPGGTVAAFVNGQVDAAVIFQPYLEQTLARPGSRLLFTTREFPNISVGCFIIREGMPNGDLIARRFIAGVRRAEIWVRDNQAEADAILRRFFSVDQQLLDTMRSGARLKGAAENARFLAPDASGDLPVMALLRNIAAYYRSRGVAGAREVSAADIHPAAASAFSGR
jgi:NitT/TauT family transport system substrate-binding protein